MEKKNKKRVGKVSLQSMSITEEQKRKLKQAFPEVFNEQKIDWDKLKVALGEELDQGPERYHTAWPGKANCFRIIQQPSYGTLKPCKQESIAWDTTKNLFIEGDNLEVLKLLQRPYYGKVKMIYIDPPYNTGKDFIYPDKYSETLDTYLQYTEQKDSEGNRFSTNQETDGRFHSKWMNMMYPRLFLARNLLKEDGVIFISIDDKEVTNLRKICDEIFGEENFLSCVTRAQKGGGNKGNYFNPVTDYIVAVAKNKNLLPFFTDYIDPNIYNKIETQGQRKGEKYAEVIIYMPNLDYRPNQRFWVKTPDGNLIAPPEGKSFRWTEDRYKEEFKNNNIIFKKTHQSKLINQNGSKADWIVYQKRFYNDSLIDEKARPNNLITDFQNMKGSKELFHVDIPFDYPKPMGLIKYLIFLSKTKNNDIILDFFAGSGTTAHAVYEKNLEDGGNRKYIMVQLPEPTKKDSEAYKDGFKNIADISKERLRRVIKKIKKDNQQKNLLDQNKNNLDLGFKVFKLNQSNFKIWEEDIADKKPAEQIKMHLDESISAKASDEDLLYEILIKTGYPPTTDIKLLKLADKKVYSIENNALLICLDKKITKQLIREMAKKHPARVVCLDRSFTDNDQLKTNAKETFDSFGVRDFKVI